MSVSKQTITALAALLCAGAALAQEGAVNYVAPQAWRSARVARPGPAVVNVSSIDAKVDIIEGVAVTVLTVKLQNPSPEPLEAVLLITVPNGAVVKSFDFLGAAKEPSAEVVPAAAAKAAYSEIVSRLRDPALLEFAGYALIRSSVFPVAPGGEQAVKIAYEHVLPSSGGMLEYVLPRTQRLADSTVPMSVSVRVRSVKEIAAVYSPTHPVETVRKAAGEVEATLKAEGATEPGSFVLGILPRAGDVTATLLAHPAPEGRGGTFLLLAGVPDEASTAAAVKRDVTMVIDCSGSMSGEKIRQAKQALLQVLQSLSEGEWFNVIAYNDSVNRFSDRALVKNRENEAKAGAYIAGLSAGGGTNLNDAVLEALKGAPREGSLPLALLLSDGCPTVGVTDESAIRDNAVKANVHKRRIFTFGVGCDLNVPLMDRLAESTRGCMTVVLPSENVEAKVSVLFDKLSGPVFTEPKIVTAGADGKPDPSVVADLLPAALPDLYRGDRVVVLGRYLGAGPLNFTLSGDYRGRTRTFAFSFDLAKASPRNSFVSRLWASRRIGTLIDAIRQMGAESEAIASAPAFDHRASSARLRPSAAPAAAELDPRAKELVDEIVGLSVKYGILTEYTSFLALEGTNLRDAEAMGKEAGRNVQERAVQTRSGQHAVAQQMNAAGQRGQSFANGRNTFIDRDMNRVEVSNVQQLSDLAFYRRNGAWVDARIASRSAEVKVDETVVFGSERFKEIFEKLLSSNRHQVLSLGTDVLFELDGKVIQIVWQTNEPEKK